MPEPEGKQNKKNKLFYGDNLLILRDRKYFPDASIDLIYLDPPFNSKQSYNVLFSEQNGSSSTSQLKAFNDTWQWDVAAGRAFNAILESGGRVAETMAAMRSIIGENDMLAYLTMMAPRLVEMRRILKETGSIYLHCDPSASHYLKVLMDSIFGSQNFRNNIVWKRRSGSTGQVHKARKFGACTDDILFYVKSNESTFHPQYNFEAEGYREWVNSYFRFYDANGRQYAKADLSSPAFNPRTIYDYKGYKSPRKGWAITLEKMKEWDEQGKLEFPKKQDGRIRRRQYLDEVKGKPVQSLWDDILPVYPASGEKLGYPTQKPEALLERIINASSNEGNLVLDPFCGGGTTIIAAHKLKRNWIGIDVTSLSTAMVRKRLNDAFGQQVLNEYEVIGEPADVTGARDLAHQDRYQFQWWALGMIGAMPVQEEQRKGADSGIDGKLLFRETKDGDVHTMVIQVKSGKLKLSEVRDFARVIEREHASIGVLLTLDEPTKEMRAEATSLGLYKPEHRLDGNVDYDRYQIITIGELFNGVRPKYLAFSNVTLKTVAPVEVLSPKKLMPKKLSDYTG